MSGVWNGQENRERLHGLNKGKRSYFSDNGKNVVFPINFLKQLSDKFIRII